MESYGHFVSVWVRKIETYQYICCDTQSMAYYVVRSKIIHSQQLSEIPLQAWFIFAEDGNIITAQFINFRADVKLDT